MKAMEFGTVVILVTMVLAAAVGYGTSRYLKRDDMPLEEYAEDYLEDRVEDYLGLPRDSIEIDLTPGSKEI